MAKTTTKRRTTQTRVAAQPVEKDSVYMLKIVMYLLVGSFWVRFVHNGVTYPVPLGILVGLAFIMHEHFAIDRKIEFAVLFIACGISLVTGYGLFIYF